MYLQKIKNYKYSGTIEAEYEHLVLRGLGGVSIHQLPHIKELVKETWHTEQLFLLEQTIQEAVERGDHEELYNMSSQEFMARAYQNRVPGFEFPTLNEYDVQNHIYTYLQEMNVTYFTYNGIVMNSPIRGGIW